MNDNLISIIIVNYNGKKWLKKLFDSLLAQTYKNFEIIFVDNASSDGSIEFIKNNYKDDRIKIIHSEKNLGFAGGNNLGFKYSKGEYIILLNSDTYVKNDYLVNFLESFNKIQNLGCVQSKLILMYDPSKLDSCGSFWTDSSGLYHYGFRKKEFLEKYNKPMRIFSVKGASMLIRRDLIDRIGLFDNDFWCYYEETDFCNRVWLAGYECWYYPKAVCYHAGGGTSLTFDNSFIQFHNFKNKLLSFLKNFEIKMLIKILPIYFLMSIALSFFWLLQGKFKHFLVIYKAFFWNIKNIKKTLNKRKRVQILRKKTDKEIFLKVKRNPRISYYFYSLKGLEKYKD